MPLTNSQLAVAFGWKWEAKGNLYNYPKGKPVFACKHYGVYKRGREHIHKRFIPNYLGSVDATIRELIRLRIDFGICENWDVSGNKRRPWARCGIIGFCADTYSEALATAAYNYLRKRK